ncbi:OVARIAN TUMOR DOMAIN-containing deubiquitinating enzyme 4 [Nicotiana tabacum]|uniref:Ubiquitin thioesterase OTU n=3 Tax=Nicotiana tabacum TaxID=4097 RepID=A0A1S4CS13_TOBAC|nr:OVARIAN TUMOR DOMAIN-containing deubiquitinating enzyme 4-like isoform X1 [Nicotiana tomentosiformis]XP_009627224.1 OVARIAN TUMOR DOMAIN-containing deubiquitinating enzyme 4-like isoform X1 [Nicotiana tomentosiformis]XP_009627225.1 OVARIAN TUMOR DOMAIN-containing deubiquitinating enzyme 4-like isoform X1 [Nicotiana tomentosiformis]XP_016503866.1 PREDICTED: OTU domain-containing protein At3g57810-like [Nicotiana tabacum]XP_016503867.1 PREDICTED: OTU domain-containing protein At3g57810-like [N
MTSRFCNIVLQAPANSLRFCISTKPTKLHYSTISTSKSHCFLSSINFDGSHKRCVGSSISKLKSSCHSLTLKTAVNPRYTWKACCDISLRSQNVNMRLSLPTQSKIPKNRCKLAHISGQRHHTCAGLFSGLLVCYSTSELVHAESSGENRANNCHSSATGYSHGKKVYTDYSVIGIPGDGRCLFRSVAHGACLRSGKPPPDENLQRQLADELRASVADEFIKRREETEWFIEGDFDTYVARIRKSHVWGGEPELLMASHVLQMPINVYMYDQDARGLISIAEYGEEYGKENPIKVLYHGFGHYDALHISGKKGPRSKL